MSSIYCPVCESSHPSATPNGRCPICLGPTAMNRPTLADLHPGQTVAVRAGTDAYVEDGPLATILRVDRSGPGSVVIRTPNRIRHVASILIDRILHPPLASAPSTPSAVDPTP